MFVDLRNPVLDTAYPFTAPEGMLVTAVALGIYAFCKLRGARPNPPSVRLHADPLQEAMDGAHRIYVNE